MRRGGRRSEGFGRLFLFAAGRRAVLDAFLIFRVQAATKRFNHLARPRV